MRTNVLKTLDVLNVSKEEALEYIKILEQREQARKQRCCIPTPLEVVYIKEDGSTEFLPQLILRRENEIFGIKVGNCIWKKTTSGRNISFYEATQLAKNENCMLPHSNDFVNMLYEANNKSDMVKTANIFRENGIEIHLPDGPETFWTREKSDDGDFIKAVNMCERDVYDYDPTRRSANAHLVRYVE